MAKSHWASMMLARKFQKRLGKPGRFLLLETDEIRNRVINDL